MSNLTTAGNLSVSNNLIVSGQTTLGNTLISSSTIEGSEIISTGNITGNGNLNITGSFTCPNSVLTCSSLSTTGGISGGTLTSLTNINGYGALNLTGLSTSNSEIIQTGYLGSNILGKTTFQGDVVINGNITANGNNGAYALTDTENINMKGCVITESYTDVSGNNNYTLQNTLLGTQFLGSISQTANNGSTPNVNSLQQTTLNGTLTLLSNLIVNSISISPIVLSYLSGLSSNLQTQLANITANFSNYATRVNPILSGIISISGILFQTGPGNMVFGNQTLTGSDNTIYGINAGHDITNQTNNTFIGSNTAYKNVGTQNTSVGAYSAYYDVSGSYNTYIGYEAGQASTDTNIYNNLTLIGRQTEPYVLGQSNQCVIGNSSTNTYVSNLNAYNQLSITGNSQSVPSQNYGLVVSNNYSLGLEGTDFINTGYNSSNGLSVPSFTFYQKTGSSTMNALVSILGTGELVCNQLAVGKSSASYPLDVVGITNTSTDYYINGSSIGNTYLTQANAASTYLTQANANTTYLTQANATSTYLTQANANTTYLTQANATSTYAPINNPSFTGNTTIGTSTSTNNYNGTNQLSPYTYLNGLALYQQNIGVWMIDNSINWRPIPISCNNPSQTVSGSLNYYTANSVYATYPDALHLNNPVFSSNSGYNYLPDNADCAYYILPNYGLIVYSDPNYSGTIQLNVLNTSPTAQTFAPVQNKQGSSWRIFYSVGASSIELSL